jgi:uncharacterized protein
MSEISRRGFLKASVVGVGATAAVGCGEGGAPGEPGGATPASATPSNPAPTNPAPTNPAPTNPAPTNPAPANPAPANPAPGNTTQPPSMSMTTTPMGPPPMAPMPSEMTGTGGMPLRALGKTGLMVSVVGFGSGSQYLAAAEAEAERLIHRAIELGVNYFDTAASYGGGESERRLGKYLIPRYRDKIVLVSKIRSRTAAGAQAEFETTLKNLGTDHLDILHFHEMASGDADRIMAKGGAYEFYARMKQEGKIRFIGLSGHSSGAILVDALKKIKPDVMMCPQNAARESGFTDLVIPYGQQNGIGLLGMKVTAQDGLLRRGVKADELVRYSLSLPVSAMIIGMRSLAVLESCASIAKGLKPLSPAEMMQVSGKLAMNDMRRCLPYRRWGYRDGCWA